MVVEGGNVTKTEGGSRYGATALAWQHGSTTSEGHESDEEGRGGVAHCVAAIGCSSSSWEAHGTYHATTPSSSTFNTT